MSTRVFDAIMSVESGTLPEHITSPVNRLSAEREAVDAYLTGPTSPKVYGFNTFLGQRDDTQATEDYQERMFAGHLVGRETNISKDKLKFLTIAKLYQLSEGGSGVSPEAFTRAVKTWPCESGLNRHGAWWDSYGAGDVIPGSWWIHSVLGRDCPEWLKPGDLIALMSGSFVSTGFALDLAGRLVDYFSGSLAVLSNHATAPVPRFAGDSRLAKAYTEAAVSQPSPLTGQQSSVAERDALPFLNTVEQSLLNLHQALENRLSMPSGNPFFHVQDGEVVGHYSQSSFMDHRLSAALLQVADTIKFVNAGVQSVLKSGQESFGPGRLEMPKLAEVSSENMQGGLDARFHVWEAAGAEDVCDRTLQRVKRTGEILDEAEAVIDLYWDQNPDTPFRQDEQLALTAVLGDLMYLGS